MSDHEVRAVLLCLHLLLMACSHQPAAPLHPAGHQAPGTRRVSCRLTTDHGPREITLDLPRGWRDGLPADYDKARGCSWYRPVQVPEDGEYDLVLNLRTVAKGKTLQDVYDEEKPDAVEGDDPAGDDSILHLDLREGVPTYGATRGDRLSFWCFCDGQDTLTRLAQADGVRLSWGSVKRLQASTDAQLDAILASIGTAS